jgi:hypothetical protein
MMSMNLLLKRKLTFLAESYFYKQTSSPYQGDFTHTLLLSHKYYMMKDCLKQIKFITKELPTKEFAIAIS